MNTPFDVDVFAGAHGVAELVPRVDPSPIGRHKPFIAKEANAFVAGDEPVVVVGSGLQQVIEQGYAGLRCCELPTALRQFSM